MIVYVTVVEHFFMCSRVATKILKITLCKKNQDSYHADNMVSFDPIEEVLLHDPEYGLLIPPSLAPKPSPHCHLQHKIHPGLHSVHCLQPKICTSNNECCKGLGKRLHPIPIHTSNI